MFTQSLHGKWDIELKRKGVKVTGNVPGDIHDALTDAGVIPNPHYDVDARQSLFISSEPIVYSKTFIAEKDFESARLSVEGIDGFADIYLNGEHLSRVENAFRRYDILVTKKLKKGQENKIDIVFTPIDEILGPRVDESSGWKLKKVYMRKSQYNYGWDWALSLPGLGVFGFVKIEYDFTREIIDYSVKGDLSGRIDFEFEVSPKAYEDKYTIKVEVDGNGESESFEINRDRYRTYGYVQLKNPKLWWPNGYGEQPLYNYTIKLICNGEVCHEIKGRIGLRKIELLEEPFTLDAGDGYSFWFLVNGKRIFIKGGNWIPMELWPGKINEKDYEFQIKMSKLANFTMLRVWGGGIYEKDRFYELCDENGILVWQDFMFASVGYPVHLLQDEIIKEANYQIRRLRNYTSIALWCGCNEDYNSWEYVCNNEVVRDFYGAVKGEEDEQSDYGTYNDVTASNEIFRPKEDPLLHTMILRGLVGRFANGVPFIESSPMSKEDAGNAVMSGNSHASCWKYSMSRLLKTHEPFESFREHFNQVCSFDSEFCIQGPCSKKLFKSFMREENHWPPNDAWTFHIQTGWGYPHHEQTLKIAGKEFGEIDSLDKYIKYGQANHLEMMRSEFESARFDYPNNGGMMMWMQNDCWTTANWAIIDYTKNPKPSYYSAKRACEKFLPIIFERKGVIYFAFSNHTFKSGELKATFGERDYDKNDITKKVATANFNECETVKFGSILKSELNAKTKYLYLTVNYNGVEYSSQVYFPYAWRNLDLPTPSYDAKVLEISKTDCGYKAEINIKANTFVRLFHVLAKGNLNPILTDNYFDMEKGDNRTITAYFSEKVEESDIYFGDFTTDWE